MGGLVIMDKKNPFFTASTASVIYFIIFIILKYSLAKKVDWMGALLGAVFFWIVIFLVHQFLKRRYEG